jgi:hypothetical protein
VNGEKEGPALEKNFIHTPKTSSILFVSETETGMGDWGRNANWNRDVLEHIVALLFALASMAELAACLPWLRRQQLLGILSHGEAEAWAFVMGLPPGAPPPEDASADDASRLAASFRALALALCALLTRRFALPRKAGPRAGRRRPARPAGRRAALAAPDTS